MLIPPLEKKFKKKYPHFFNFMECAWNQMADYEYTDIEHAITITIERYQLIDLNNFIDELKQLEANKSFMADLTHKVNFFKYAFGGLAVTHDEFLKLRKIVERKNNRVVVD